MNKARPIKKRRAWKYLLISPDILFSIASRPATN
jgi:hypothetical protein